MCSSYKLKYIININILFIMINSLLAINNDHVIDENEGIEPSIENLLAEVIAGYNDFLQMNVTWNSNVKDDQLFDVAVEPVQQNNITCSSVTCIEHNINGTEVVFPKYFVEYHAAHYDCKIERSCQYNISVKLIKSYFQTNLIYTVPDCVGNICSCHHKNNLPNTSLTVNFKPPEINITWIINKSNKILPMDVNITNIRIKIDERSNPSLSWVVHNLESITQSLILPNGSIIYKGYHRTILKEQIKPDHELIITSNVEDSRNCSGNTSNVTRIVRAVLKNDSRQSDESTNYKLLVIIILPIIIIITIVSITLQRYRRKIRKENAIQNWRGVYHNVPSRQTGGIPAHIAMEDNFLYVDKDILDARSRGDADLLEIPHSCLTIGREIGKGAFGRVFIARADNIGGKLGSQVVAVKKLKKRPSPDELEEFLSEITTMKTVSRHPNVVSLIGCCTIKQPLLMIMEFVGCGDLLHYLRQVRTKHEARSTAVSGIINPQHTQIVNNNNNNNIITLSNQNLNLDQQQQKHQQQHQHQQQQQQQHHQHQHQQQQQQQQQTILGPFGKYLELLHSSNSGTSNSDASYVTQPDSMTSTVRPSVTETLYTTLSQNPELASLTGSSLEYVLDHKELHKFALQIARGMRHLEERQITHRDLAARNILIDENKTLKISDFGLSRSGIYVNTRNKKVPLRWLSLEAIRDNLYSSKSDVWAFGIVLWEIGTLGGFPYPTVGNHELLQYLNSGQRLQRPENCSEQLYDLMLQCWTEKPEDRPQFSDIVTKLEPSNQKIYVDFNELGADYIFPPTAEQLRYRNAPTLNN